MPPCLICGPVLVLPSLRLWPDIPWDGQAVFSRGTVIVALAAVFSGDRRGSRTSVAVTLIGGHLIHGA